MFEKGQVVYSAAGHDQGSFYVEVAVEEGGFCRIADGRRRKLAAPKQKNQKHLRPTRMRVELETIGSDRALRGALAALCHTEPAEGPRE